MTSKKITMSNAKYQLLTGGLVGLGIAAGFGFSMKSDITTSWIITIVFGLIGLILLVSSRFTK